MLNDTFKFGAGGRVIAVLTFHFIDLICDYKDVVEWHGGCKAEFINTSPNDYPLRSDVTFLNRIKVDLSVRQIAEGQLNADFLTQGLDEQIAAWRLEGYPAANDVMVMRYWPKDKNSQEFLGIQIGMQQLKYEHFCAFLTRHFARPDLDGQIITSFHGFSAPPQPYPDLPTKNEFLSGRTYFIMGDHSVRFSARQLPATP